jgi:hypothetical protein
VTPKILGAPVKATTSAAIAKATVSAFNPERSNRAAMEANLFDLDQKYAYVVTSAEGADLHGTLSAQELTQSPQRQDWFRR